MNRRLIIVCVLVLAAILIVSLGLKILRQPTITVITDNTPVSMQFDNQKLSIGSPKQKVRLGPGTHNYRATYDLAGDTITLYGSVDASRGQNVIVLNYNVFTKQYIKQAMCRLDGVSPADCGESYTPQKLAFTDDHAWAVVTLTPSEELGTDYEVLQLQNGSWKKITGPLETQDLQGIVPAAVLEVINR